MIKRETQPELEAGWYWRPLIAGGMISGIPIGPFETREEAKTAVLTSWARESFELTRKG